MDAEKRKISFIINPKSGTQSKEQILHLLDERLDRTKYIPEIVYTEYAGHAIEIAAQRAKENVFAVVAIGIRNHSLWFGQWLGTPPANTDGTQESNRNHQRRNHRCH